MKRGFLFLYLFFITMTSYTQQILTLNDYRKKVLDYNQDIKQSLSAIDRAIYAMKAIKAGFFPRVDLTANYSYQLENIEFMEGVDLKHDNFGVEAGVIQNIYSGSSVNQQYKISQLQEAIARLGADYTLTNIIYAADINYWTALANRDLTILSDEFVRIVKELYTIVDIRFQKGAISKTDLLMVQTRLKEAELQRNGYYTKYRTALQALNVMMGSLVDEEIVFGDSIYSISASPTYMVLDSALENRSDYLISVKKTEVSKRQTRLVKAGYLPQVVAGVKEQYGTTMINIDGKSKFATIAFAQINIPVFYWKERRQKVRESQILQEQSRLEQSKLKDQVNQELNSAWVNMTEALERVKIVNSTLEIAQSNLELNTYSYNEGRLPILDVLSAQVAWLQAYTNVVTVHYQYKTAEAQYIKAIGGAEGF